VHSSFLIVAVTNIRCVTTLKMKINNEYRKEELWCGAFFKTYGRSVANGDICTGVSSNVVVVKASMHTGVKLRVA
jgi:hypothetical protein